MAHFSREIYREREREEKTDHSEERYFEYLFILATKTFVIPNLIPIQTLKTVALNVVSMIICCLNLIVCNCNM